MLTGRGILAIISIVAVLALLRAFIPVVQRFDILWLIAVSIGAPWIVWHGAKQLYVAAMHGYVITGVPERRVYREDDTRLFRNNVICWIVLFPIITAGAVVMLLEALQAQHIIR